MYDFYTVTCAHVKTNSAHVQCQADIKILIVQPPSPECSKQVQLYIKNPNLHRSFTVKCDFNNNCAIL